MNLSRRRKQIQTKAQPTLERRLATINGRPVVFSVKAMNPVGEQEIPSGTARVWGAYGPAVSGNELNVGGKFVGVRYRWLFGTRIGDEEARLFDCEPAARSFANAPVRKVKIANATG